MVIIDNCRRESVVWTDDPNWDIFQVPRRI